MSPVNVSPLNLDTGMQNSYVFHAWKWLLAHLLVAATISYTATVLIAEMYHLEPATLLKAATFGLPHVGMMVTKQGFTFGIDAWLMLFACNLTVALLIVALVHWARLLNPYSPSQSFLRLRRYLQKDRTAEYLRKIPTFARIQSPQLRISSFLLLVIPHIAAVALGLMAGNLIAIGKVFSSSLLVGLAYILPHGIPEFAAILLACSIPVGIWRTIRSEVGNVPTAESFQSIDRVVKSQQFQQDLKMIINLLLIAGLTEAYLTNQVVAMFSGS